jgi:hypothetical protein
MTVRLRPRGPQFDEIKDAVWQEIVHATSTYALLTRVIFPICNERRLRRAYPLIVPSLKHVFTGAALMGLCRLFEPKGDASLAKFLKRLEAQTADKVSADRAERRRHYLQTIPYLLKEIEPHWRSLVIHRNGYLAHLDLSKAPRIAQTRLTYRDIRLALELAQKIFGGYRGAFDGVDPSMLFEPIELRTGEPDEFLRNHFDLGAGT